MTRRGRAEALCCALLGCIDRHPHMCEQCGKIEAALAEERREALRLAVEAIQGVGQRFKANAVAEVAIAAVRVALSSGGGE